MRPTCAHSDASAPTPHQPSCEAIDHARNVATRARAPRRRARVASSCVRRVDVRRLRRRGRSSVNRRSRIATPRRTAIACHQPLHAQTQNVTQPRSNDTHARTRPSPAVRHTRCAPLHAPTHPTPPPTHTTTHAITPHHTTHHTDLTTLHAKRTTASRRHKGQGTHESRRSTRHASLRAQVVAREVSGLARRASPHAPHRRRHPHVLTTHGAGTRRLTHSTHSPPRTARTQPHASQHVVANEKS